MKCAFHREVLQLYLEKNASPHFLSKVRVCCDEVVERK